MAREPKLFQWTGWAPKGAHRPDSKRTPQVSCAAVFSTKAEFMRVTGRRPGDMPYVSVMEVRTGLNETSDRAIAEPGKVFWRDDVRHIRRDAPVLEHLDPEHS